MRLFLKLLFAGICLLMIVVNLRAAGAMSLMDAFPRFGSNPWAVATLYDAYCGFLTFYVWVFYKERRPVSRAIWFVLVMGLGNVAMSITVLKELFRLAPDEPVWRVLQRRVA